MKSIVTLHFLIFKQDSILDTHIQTMSSSSYYAIEPAQNKNLLLFITHAATTYHNFNLN